MFLEMNENEMTHDSAGLGVGRCLGWSERTQNGERSREMFERVRLWTTARYVEKLSQKQHRGVSLPWPTRTCRTELG